MAENEEIKDPTPGYEFNSYYDLEFVHSIYNCGVFDYFDETDIENVLANPIANHDLAKRLSNFIYTKDGVVANSIDYMAALPCLDRVIVAKSKKNAKKVKQNKAKMKEVLAFIDDKAFIRDALQTEMVNGICFYYFDTLPHKESHNKYLTDYDVETIWEINSTDLNVNVLTLPYQYTRIVGKRNGRYQLAFNLRYFDELPNSEVRDMKLRKYPKEIVDGYWNYKKKIYKNWLVLDNDHTICRKIKCKDSEPWGRPLAISALNDILYKDSFVGTKRKILDDINNRVFYETFPEGQVKGTCSLTQKQQERQHNDVKSAILDKNSRNGISFFSVAAGTKIDTIDVSTDIFDDKNESDLNNQISLDMGISSTLLGASSTGANYAVQQSNLELITAQIYRWIYELQFELNYVINKTIIKDERNKVEIYYFPTSFVNRSKFFDQMKTLYSEAAGSLSFLIAAGGIDPDLYLSVLDDEISDGIFEKYMPHQTSYTMSSSDTRNAGRPTDDESTNVNTIISKATNSNGVPKPSTE